MFFSPEIRLASSAVGGTFCGGAGGGGGGGGGGAATTPVRSPPTAPPSTPPSTPLGSPASTTGGASFCSIFTGWTMSRTFTFFGVIVTSLGFTPPLGGGGGGGGGGAMARSTALLGRSSCSRSQIVFTHIVVKITIWTPSIAVSSGPAHLGILRFLAASKFPNMWGTTCAWAGFVLPDLSNGVVFSMSRGMVGCSLSANQPDFSAGAPVVGGDGGFGVSAGGVAGAAGGVAGGEPSAGGGVAAGGVAGGVAGAAGAAGAAAGAVPGAGEPADADGAAGAPAGGVAAGGAAEPAAGALDPACVAGGAGVAGAPGGCPWAFF